MNSRQYDNLQKAFEFLNETCWLNKTTQLNELPLTSKIYFMGHSVTSIIRPLDFKCFVFYFDVLS